MKKVLVLLSGGQDSCTCLVLATKQFKNVYSISFDYGQRHRIELECSKKLADLAGVEHFEMPISSLKFLGDSSLIGLDENIDNYHRGDQSLPASFVPGRNYLFLGLAAAKAYQLGVHHLMTGVCQTDFSGYPDCRDTSIKAVQGALFLCLDYPIYIHTPLMWKTKAETIFMMKELGKLDWYRYTHTCYEGGAIPCGKCPACKLRARGFEEAGIVDPLMW
ncbi:7-cyano-7-deazaguanine synthase QueC [Patescibacteria group bacterium]|nr:7-cyano-7-deazaguanine synthase QueC [Patescibacteria group bacterium]